jgi:hypothetical protein
MSTYEPIASQTLGASSTAVTFSSIPQNYTDLRIICNVNGVAGSGDYRVGLRFNSDTATNYSITSLLGNGTTASSTRETSRPFIDNSISIPEDSSGEFGIASYDIMNYSNSSTYKTVLFRQSTVSTTPVNQGASAAAGLWRNTAAITSVTVVSITNNPLAAGSNFTIYGIAAGNSSAKASGGNIVTTDGSYWYHAFTSSGTFIPSQALTCDYLVVAGGGGAGGAYGGGGGAGGLRSTVTATGGGGSLESPLSLSANTVYQALVGAGGIGARSNVRGSNGGNSTFATITSLGGGAGGTTISFNNSGANGGSGGGACYGNISYGGQTALGTSGQGYNGGDGKEPGKYPTAGGGGAGQVGGTPATTTSNAGNGGNGVQITALATATGTGANSGYYAGGGGGGQSPDAGGNTGGTGGSGGGGNGGLSTNNVGVAGLPNTGGGAGGNSGGGGGNGPNGGSGIVIIRYAV